MRFIQSRWAMLMLALTATTLSAQSTPKGSVDQTPFVSPIFGDNMVLQRDKANTIWGWSDPGDVVTVQVGDKTTTATAQADKKWSATIQPPATGGPYTVKVSGKVKQAELKNVMVGDVWLCSGQSNMEFAMRGVKDADKEISAANFPNIRFFVVAQKSGYRPVNVPSGSWQAVSPETAPRLSAVAYFFARKVQQEINVPIGLVIDAIGGTPAETWTSAAALHQLKDFDDQLSQLKRLSDEGAPEYGNYIDHWYDHFDIGLKEKWQQTNLDESAWKTVTLSEGFRQLGTQDVPAVVYFRKQIEIPAVPTVGRNVLHLGIVDTMDTVWLNGERVGGSAWVENPRNYTVPASVLKPGKNELVIRVFKGKPEGGFRSKPDEIELRLADNHVIPLASDWKAKISVDARPPHEMPFSFQNWPVIPSVLYEGMIAPIAPLSITGALWYQGEANSERAFQYRTVLPAMISDWRNAFRQPNLPFYVVGLPAFKQRSSTPKEDSWAEMREAQALTVATVPNTCMAVTIDTGDAGNIHPKDKLPVGERLARCALAKQYGRSVAYEGPTVDKVEKRSSSIQLHFNHTEGGLVVKGDSLGQFQITGDDHKWMWADAHVSGDYIIVSTSLIQNPEFVRYAWDANPKATLFNGAGLPAAPFRTDNWKGITEP